jgi:hypothetical protein
MSRSLASAEQAGAVRRRQLFRDAGKPSNPSEQRKVTMAWERQCDLPSGRQQLLHIVR